jgi:hypothetical protein
VKNQLFWCAWITLLSIGSVETEASKIRLVSGYDAPGSYADALVTTRITKNADFVSMWLTMTSSEKTVEKREAEITEGRRELLERTKDLAGIQVFELPVEQLNRPYSVSKISSFSSSSTSSEPSLSQVSFEIRARFAEDEKLLDVVNRIRRLRDSLKLPSKVSKHLGDPISLGIDRAEQYRPELLKRIAEDVRLAQEQLGEKGTVRISGLESPVRLRRNGVRELELFIPYTLAIEL